jgi:signal transduction histidine kinase
MSDYDAGQQQTIEQTPEMKKTGKAMRGIAHDLNNILATISLYAELVLQQPELSSLSQERLETIFEQARDGTDLVQQLRRLSR